MFLLILSACPLHAAVFTHNGFLLFGNNLLFLTMKFLSQIGLVIEDKEFIESSMNGNPWMAGNFASSLRLSLWSEHLGLLAGEVGN